MVGCGELRPNAICEVDDGSSLTLWIERVDRAELTVTIDQRPVQTATVDEDVMNGVRMRINALVGTLAVRVGDGASWNVQLAPHVSDADLADVARKRRSGDLIGAESNLRAIEARDPSRAGIAAQHARNALAAARIDEALQWFQRAIREDETDARLLALTRDRTALSHTLLNYGHRFEEAAAALAPLEPIRDAEVQSDLAYFNAELAFEFRDIRGTLKSSNEALAYAERLALDDVVIDMAQLQLGAWAFIGRWSEVKGTVERLQTALASVSSSCKRAELLSNIGWYSTLGRAHARRLFSDWPVTTLERAAEIYSNECDRPALRANAELNLAWVNLLAQNTPGARPHVEAAKKLTSRSELRSLAQLMHVEAELALASGKSAEAIESFERFEGVARQTQHQAWLWEALLGKGRAFDQAGARNKAIASYRAAEEVLDDLSVRVPLGEGRDAFLYDRTESAQRLIGALIHESRLDEALAAARRSSLRELSRLDPLEALELERASRGREWEKHLRSFMAAQAELDRAAERAWRLPAKELERARKAQSLTEQRAREALDLALLARTATKTASNLSPLSVSKGELALVLHPVIDGVAALTYDGQRVRALHFSGATESAALASTLTGYTGVRVYAHAALEQLDVHALMVNGAPLLEQTMVEYVADLSEPRTRADTKVALVLGDPVEALPRARTEAEHVAVQLTNRGYSVEALYGSEIDRARLLDVLSSRELSILHYSGHGSQRGIDGLGSGFPLSGASRFAASDAIVLHRAPRLVVLSACELAQRGSQPGKLGLGLAYAFLIAGSERVVAATRAVSDADTASLIERFYASLDREHDASWALRAAQLDLHMHAPTADWSAFRAIARR